MRYWLLMIGYWLLCVCCGAKGPVKTEQANTMEDTITIESTIDIDVEYTKEDSALRKTG